MVGTRNRNKNTGVIIDITDDDSIICEVPDIALSLKIELQKLSDVFGSQSIENIVPLITSTLNKLNSQICNNNQLLGKFNEINDEFFLLQQQYESEKKSKSDIQSVVFNLEDELLTSDNKIKTLLTELNDRKLEIKSIKEINDSLSYYIQNLKFDTNSCSANQPDLTEVVVERGHEIGNKLITNRSFSYKNQYKCNNDNNGLSLVKNGTLKDSECVCTSKVQVNENDKNVVDGNTSKNNCKLKNRDKRIYIFGDSHGRDIAVMLKKKLTQPFVVQGNIYSGAPISFIKKNVYLSVDAKNLCSQDWVILIGGTNYFSETSNFGSVSNFVNNWKQLVNIYIQISLPVRYGIVQAKFYKNCEWNN